MAVTSEQLFEFVKEKAQTIEKYDNKGDLVDKKYATLEKESLGKALEVVAALSEREMMAELTREINRGNGSFMGPLTGAAGGIAN